MPPIWAISVEDGLQLGKALMATITLLSNNFSYAIVVVGETPYAETAGDSLNLTIAEPGTEGQGVADVLFGDDGFTGKLPRKEERALDKLSLLPRTWFKTVDQLHMNVGDSHYDPLFSYDFGLTTKPVNAS
ncbi:hypothetical protein NC653_023825 [Populus alba x Populus x berolinensis]|uniref:beta-glucosidase n=1 Tax=Populus alba x Populus x berolinensis TaxID=444605 RepID=A0AAD6QBI0_9ROSI|nr:hypothetical protein NC653_023825 [Populus alba x Populus x berolinensis]